MFGNVTNKVVNEFHTPAFLFGYNNIRYCTERNVQSNHGSLDGNFPTSYFLSGLSEAGVYLYTYILEVKLLISTGKKKTKNKEEFSLLSENEVGRLWFLFFPKLLVQKYFFLTLKEWKGKKKSLKLKVRTVSCKYIFLKFYVW